MKYHNLAIFLVVSILAAVVGAMLAWPNKPAAAAVDGQVREEEKKKNETVAAKRVKKFGKNKAADKLD